MLPIANYRNYPLLPIINYHNYPLLPIVNYRNYPLLPIIDYRNYPLLPIVNYRNYPLLPIVMTEVLLWKINLFWLKSGSGLVLCMEVSVIRKCPLVEVPLLCLTNRLHFSVCVYCNRSQMTSAGKEQKKYKTKSSGVTVVLYTLRRLLWSIAVHTEKCNLFVSYNKNSNGILKYFAGMKKKILLTWFWRHMCVYPLIDHVQQPMKMQTEVTLLYNHV